MRKILFKTLLLSAAVSGLAYFCYTLPNVNGLKTANPTSSALMELRDREYKQKGVRPPRRQLWQPFGAISENLKKAVLLAEDAAFFSHKVIDVAELQEALKKDWETGSFKRGHQYIQYALLAAFHLAKRSVA